MRNVKASIVVISFNESKYISKCLKSILNQSFRNFEIIIVDENSNDGTQEILRKFKRKNIKLIFSSSRNRAIARNIGIKAAYGEYIFFIDADCVASKNWLKNGIKSFEKNIGGVEGRVYYVSRRFKPTMKDKVVSNMNGGIYSTSNMAYRKNILKQVRGFNPKYIFAEDVDIALRVLTNFKIVFNPKMEVAHQQKVHNFHSFFRDTLRFKYGTMIIIEHYQKNHYNVSRIAFPYHLAITMFPPFLFLYFILAKKRIQNFDDILFIPLYYIKSVLIRAIIWRTAFSNKFFLI